MNVDDIITFKDNNKYLITDSITYNDKDYYLLLGVDSKETKINEENMLFATIELEDDKVFFREVTDLSILRKIGKIFLEE